MADQNKVTVSTVYRDCEFNNIKGSNILNIAFTNSNFLFSAAIEI